MQARLKSGLCGYILGSGCRDSSFPAELFFMANRRRDKGKIKSHKHI